MGLPVSLFVIVFKKYDVRNRGGCPWFADAALFVRFSPSDGHGGHPAALEIPLHHCPCRPVAFLPPSLSRLKLLSDDTERGRLRGLWQPRRASIALRWWRPAYPSPPLSLLVFPSFYPSALAYAAFQIETILIFHQSGSAHLEPSGSGWFWKPWKTH